MRQVFALTWDDESPLVAQINIVTELTEWAKRGGHSEEDLQYFREKLGDWMGVSQEWLNDNVFTDRRSLVDIQNLEDVDVNS